MSLFVRISSCTILIPAVLAIYSFRKLQGFSEKLFAAFMWVTVTNQALMIVYASLHKHNIFISTIFCLVEGVILITVTGGWIKNKIIREKRYYIAAIYTLLWFAAVYKFGLDIVNPAVFLTENTLLCILSGYVLINIMVNIEEKPTLSFAFWACAGIFLFFLCTISVESLWLLLPFNSEKYYGILHSTINIIGNLLFAMAFWSRLRSKQARVYI